MKLLNLKKMTKIEAYFALGEGHSITHPSLPEGVSYHLIKDIIYDENGKVVVTLETFMVTPFSDDFEDNWFVKEENKTPKQELKARL